VLDLAIRRIDSIGLESLTNAWHSLTTCIKVTLKAKLESSPEKAMDFLETTHYKQNLGSDPSKSLTAGVIWELKEKPSWD
jgi:hypothetical protein